MDPYLSDELARMAASAHQDTQDSDKRAARRDAIDRSTANRRRNHGKGSPVYAAIEYINRLTPHEAVRVAATVLAAARMRALDGTGKAERIRLWWECVAAEAEKEGRDRTLLANPATWDFRAMADATARDGGVELLKEALLRGFAKDRITADEVLDGAR